MLKNMSLSEQITYSTVKIMAKTGDLITRGTGFSMKICEDEEKNIHTPVLITNKHVIEGSEVTKLVFCKKNSDETPNDKEKETVILNSQRWIMHPDVNVDLACLPIADIVVATNEKNTPIFYNPIARNMIATQEKLEELSAMEEIIMIGYPCGISDEFNNKPLIRRGVTSTHPKKDYQGKSEFLVDIACMPGSSGSPIFVWNEMGYSTSTGIIMGRRILLIGVNYATPRYSSTGQLITGTIPTEFRPKVDVPTNLAVAIKAEKILDFENIIYDMMKQQGEQQ